MILDQILKRKILKDQPHSLKHFKCVSISFKWHCEDELKVKVNESIVPFPFPFPFHCSFPKTLNVFFQAVAVAKIREAIAEARREAEGQVR